MTITGKQCERLIELADKRSKELAKRRRLGWTPFDILAAVAKKLGVANAALLNPEQLEETEKLVNGWASKKGDVPF